MKNSISSVFIEILSLRQKKTLLLYMIGLLKERDLVDPPL